MSFHGVCSFLTVALVVIGFIPYIRAVVDPANPAKPVKVTWLIWVSLDAITWAGMASKHTVGAQIVVSTLCAGTVALLSLWYGVAGWSLADKICAGIGAVSVVLLCAPTDPILSIIVSLVGVWIAGIPTFVSAWRNPERESLSAWVILLFSCLAGLGAVQAWTLAGAAQPIVFFAIEAVMVAILVIRKVPR